tara:strand:+ start:416 stop:1651 length:1236 start_codon:yes stop_codon:yes gene_type:complete
MLVCKQFKVIHNHTKSDFSHKTYSGFKKSDVLSAFSKSIKKGKIENANTWSIEMILSGYIENYWKKIIPFISKEINIYNTYLPIYIINLYEQYNNLIEKKIDNIEMRNILEIRNNICGITNIISLSTKKPLPKFPKINKDNVGIIHDKSKLLARDLNLIKPFIKVNDNTEVIVAINELATVLNINNNTYAHQEKCMFWLAWLQYYSIEKGDKICGERITTGVHQSLSRDVSFFIWQIILNEAKNRENARLYNCIVSLCKLFKTYITKGNIKTKYIHLQHACLLLLNTLPGINFKMSIFPNTESYIKYTCKINYYYQKIINDTKRKFYENVQKEESKKKVKLPEKIEIINTNHGDTYKKFVNKTKREDEIPPEAKPLNKKNKLVMSEINSLLTNEYDIANHMSQEYENYGKK